MAISIKNPNVDILVDKISEITGESKTEVIRAALAKRLEELKRVKPVLTAGDYMRQFLESVVWPQVPKGQLGKKLSKAEEEKILGFDHRGS